MTACVNKNHGRRVAGVVTASLVGALTLGGVSLAAVPTVALAEQGATEQFVDGGGDNSEFVNGTASLKFTPSKGSTASTITSGEDAYGNVTVTADQIPFTATIEKVSVAGDGGTGSGNLVEEDVKPGGNYKVALYKADKDGNPTGSPLSGNRVLEVGDYVVTATGLSGSKYEGKTFKQAFKAVAAQIQANAPYENGSIADTKFVFTGSALDLGFYQNVNSIQKKLTEGTDYKVSYKRSSDGKVVDKVTDAGKYTATLTGLGIYAGTSATSAEFEVHPFYMNSETTVTVAPFTDAVPDHASSVFHDDPADDDLDTSLDPSLVNIIATGVSASGYYGYTAKVDQAAVDAGNVVYSDGTVYDNDKPFEVASDANGNTTVNTRYAGASSKPTFTALSKVDALGGFSYNGSTLAESYDILPGQKFNPSDVKATFNGKTLTVTPHWTGVSGALDGDNTSQQGQTFELTFTYTTEEANTNNTWVAASKTVKVHVWKGSIDAEKDLYAYLNGETPSITGLKKAYDGTQLAANNFYVANKDASATNFNGALDVQLFDADGKKVDYATNAGSYTLKVTSKDYLITGADGSNELKIDISKVDLSTLKVGRLLKWNAAAGAGEEYFPYNNQPVSTNYQGIANLGLVWQTGNEASDADGADDTTLDATSRGGKFEENDFKGFDWIPDNADVTVEYNDAGTWKPVSRIAKAGDYRVTVTVGDDVKSNFVLPEGKDSVTVDFKASDSKKFVDVQPSAWYYEYVTLASDTSHSFMLGDRDSDGNFTGTFRPEASLTRAEAVQVLMNMSGTTISETDDSFDANHGTWNTGFDDVAGNHWAAKAITWAKKAGVVNGYDGTNDFRPDQTVTRNEFAKMLFNYAQKVAQDSTTSSVDTSVLKFSDGVDGWAQEAVAWAVSTPSKIKGETGSTVISGYPADNTFKGNNQVKRAEVAKMAVSYQTAKLK